MTEPYPGSNYMLGDPAFWFRIVYAMAVAMAIGYYLGEWLRKRRGG